MEMEYFSKPLLYRLGLLNAQVTLMVIKNSGTVMMNSAHGRKPIRLIDTPIILLNQALIEDGIVPDRAD
tara:strand:+ start:543 stop:749 length:207 start_codon:yes stop_codon:yes gene_type:complete